MYDVTLVVSLSQKLAKAIEVGHFEIAHALYEKLGVVLETYKGSC